MSEKIKICVVGLGYVGLPIAVAFAEKNIKTIAFDLNKEKVNSYNNGIDVTNEVGNERLKKLINSDSPQIIITSDENDLKEANFYIAAVPTPVNEDNTPDLSMVKGASKIIGQNIGKGDIVVFESTVYPGVTEEICVPIIEAYSGLTCGQDFKIGYSPERINPSDKEHKLNTIVKVVSGMDEDSLDIIAKTYNIVVDAGVYKASSIKVAEAAKVIENSQRDINIAFMNELSIIFDKMGIDTKEVLAAAKTKWNFLNFTPGLVGGHCIGVDPYYLTYKANQLGLMPEVILSGRRINDSMGKYIAEKTVKKLIYADIPVKGAKVAILGLTFKENCGDIRNSKVIDIINELREYGIQVVISDPHADEEEAKREYGVSLLTIEEIENVSAVIVAVAHNEYKDIEKQILPKMYLDNIEKVLIDVKGIFDRKSLEKNYIYWRL